MREGEHVAVTEETILAVVGEQCPLGRRPLKASAFRRVPFLVERQVVVRLAATEHGDAELRIEAVGQPPLQSIGFVAATVAEINLLATRIERPRKIGQPGIALEQTGKFVGVGIKCIVGARRRRAACIAQLIIGKPPQNSLDIWRNAVARGFGRIAVVIGIDVRRGSSAERRNTLLRNGATRINEQPIIDSFERALRIECVLRAVAR